MSARRAKRRERISRAEFKAAVLELIDRGLITCTSGTPGEDDATYALAWLPLDNPNQHPDFIQRLHACRVRKFLGDGS